MSRSGSRVAVASTSSDTALAKLAEEQTTYEAELRKREEDLHEARALELAKRRDEDTKAQRDKLASKKTELDREVTRIRDEQNDDFQKKRLALETQLETLTRDHGVRMEKLRTEVAEHERLVGMTAKSKSLSEVIHDRVAAGDYDEHLDLSVRPRRRA